jgi:hypothetical protein
MSSSWNTSTVFDDIGLSSNKKINVDQAQGAKQVEKANNCHLTLYMEIHCTMSQWQGFN